MDYSFEPGSEAWEAYVVWLFAKLPRPNQLDYSCIINCINFIKYILKKFYDLLKKFESGISGGLPFLIRIFEIIFWAFLGGINSQ